MKQRQQRASKRGFSLLELVVVIAIMGVLTALILPSFKNIEDEAKDTGCDYNQAGTLRFLHTFKQLNGVYPADLHTGLIPGATAASTLSAVVMGNDLDGTGVYSARLPGMVDSDGAVPSSTAGTVDSANYLAAADVTKWEYTGGNYAAGSSLAALTAAQAKSLADAGIVEVINGGYSADAGSTAVAPVKATVGTGTVVAAVNGTRAWEDDGSVFSINGRPLAAYRYTDPAKAVLSVDADTFAITDTTVVADNPVDGIVVPLWVTNSTNWDKVYAGGSMTSKVQDSKMAMANAGRCPWPGGDEFRFYIAFFKVYDDGTPATLIGTSCPECGSLNP